MSNLSELLPAGAGAKSAEFVASGTLSSGQAVAVTADGKVTAITADAVGFSSSGGFQVSTYDVGGGLPYGVYIPGTSTIVVAFTNTGSYGSKIYTCVGTVVGDAIEFTSPVLLSNNGTTNTRGLVYDPDTDQIILLVAQGNSSSQYLKNYVGTLNNNSVTWSNIQDIYTADRVYAAHIIYDSATQKMVAMAVNNNSDLISSVGTVSVGSVSWANYQFFNNRARNFTLVYDATNSKIAIAYRDSSSPYHFRTRIGAVNGSTDISWGSVVTVYEDGASNRYAGAQVDYDQVSGKLLYSGSDTATAGLINFVGTVSGTSVTLSSSTTKNGAQYRPDNGNLVYNSTTGVSTLFLSKTTALEISIAGTTVTYGDSGTFATDVSNVTPVIYDSLNNKTILFYTAGSAGTYFNQGGAKFYYAPSSNNVNFVGITDQAIADTATGAVIVQGGVSEKLSGLTVGADYYVQADGSLAAGATNIPYDISGATYDSKVFNAGSQENAAEGLAFNADGTKMFIVGTGSDTVYEYNLATAFDISTAAYNSVSFSVGSQETTPGGLDFSPDGTKMYIAGYTNDTVFQYTLSTAFGLSTASYSGLSFDVSGQENGLQTVVFNPAGSKMYIRGFSNNTFFQYSLSTPHNVSTASYDSVSFTPTAQGSQPIALAFNADGTKCFVANGNTDAIFQYSLSSAYNVGTASYDSISLSVSAQNNQPKDIAFSADGGRLFLIGQAGGSYVYQYSTPLSSFSTTVPAGRALSTTSILLEG